MSSAGAGGKREAGRGSTWSMVMSHPITRSICVGNGRGKIPSAGAVRPAKREWEEHHFELVRVDRAVPVHVRRLEGFTVATG